MTEIRCAIELREDESRQSPGRIFGTLLEYETRARDRAEVFKAGSLSWPESGIILNMQHDRQQPIFRFTPEQRGSEIVIDAALGIGTGEHLARIGSHRLGVHYCETVSGV